ncbi:MAG TPA: riboflavin biosynthesis protein RibF [Anaerolineales bacterium]|nr:riboflavin biosynthesis protein RibF [Anaerolineales bacterium]
MTSASSLEELNIPSSWVTIGIFDGVHLGHQRILKTLVAGAHNAGLPALVVTFDPHPAQVLAGIQLPRLLTSLEKENILRLLGVDLVICLTFTREMAALSASTFLRQLKQATGFTHLFTGYDFALGKNRAGNNIELSKIASEMGFTHQVFPAFEMDGKIISSTLLRDLVAAGEVEFAAKALGRPYQVSGIVVRGDGRGRTISIPTANVSFPAGKVLPKVGVYASVVTVRGQRFAAVTNFGMRPTFVEQALAPRLEPHILDFDMDIYDEQVDVEFIRFLRPEMRFNGPDALVEQIKRDIATTRAMCLV